MICVRKIAQIMRKITHPKVHRSHPGQFETIVIDPPWPMTKIERDLRPNQAGFSYPTMSDGELREFASAVKGMAADDCRSRSSCPRSWRGAI
jgi:hypothetical protein